MFIFFKNGVLNQALGAVGLERLLAAVGLQPPVDWLGDTRTALPAIMAQNIWSTSGFFMIVFLAGLQDIPESLYEAARVDGRPVGSSSGTSRCRACAPPPSTW